MRQKVGPSVDATARGGAVVQRPEVGGGDAEEGMVVVGDRMACVP